MSVKVKKIMDYMDKWAPACLAEDWDNPGLNLGDKNYDVEKIIVALDAEEGVIDEANEKNAHMIITHHPFFFSGVKKIDASNPTGRKIYKLIQNNISVFCAHTNLDVAKGGTNDVLAQLCGLKNIGLLQQTDYKKLYKIVVYVPEGYEEQVKNAMFENGAGHIGNYSCCSFYCEGTGTFMPLEGTKPFLGSINEIEKAHEIRLETVVTEDILDNVIEKIKQAHPYEEVAYDVFKLEIEGQKEGIGRTGELEKPMTLKDFAAMVKNKLGLEKMVYVGDDDRIIKKVALCTGSGMSFLNQAKSFSADVYISADIKYHETQKAAEMGISLIDVTHYAGENIIVPVIKEYIENMLKKDGLICEVIESEFNGQPFKFI